MGAAEFRQNFLKVLKREHISRAISDGKSLAEIKKSLRELTKTKEILDIVNNLLESPIIVEQRRAALANDMSIALKARFPSVPNLSVILMGSAVHGGGELREVMHNPGSSDIDWALTCDNNSLDNPDVRQRMMEVAEKCIEDKATTHGLEAGFHSCDSYNGGRYFRQNFTSADDCKTFIEFSFISNITVPARSLEMRANNAVERLVMFFQPTFPVEVGNSNREFIIAALQSLAQENPDLWKEVVKRMKSAWRQLHIIKAKHIMKNNRNWQEYDYKTHMIATDLSDDEAMSEPFYRLLDSIRP